MSGGQLVVLDRLGRDVKRFPLAEGLVTLGSDHSCDIRFMLDTVNPHHATVAVHANQTVVRNVSSGETLVNGRCVSVAALRHGDVISIGGRQLRWDYADVAAPRPQAPQPALYVVRRGARAARRASGPAARRQDRDPQLQLRLEMAHRASMPANAGGKQVAIVQPQRRDTNEQIEKPPRTPIQIKKRSRASRNELDTSASDVEAEKVPRKSSLRASPALHGTTKATLWIESRKSSPRAGAASPKSATASPRSATASPRTATASPRNTAASPRTAPSGTSPRPALRRAASARKSTPLRLTVLKRAQSAQKMKVTKIEAPLKIDHTKQAAILLMTGHTNKSRLLAQKTPSPKSETLKPVTPKSVSPKPVTPKSVSPKSVGRRSASFVVKKKSPVVRRSTPRGRSSRLSGAAPLTDTPTDRTVTILEITDSVGRNSTVRQSSRRSQRSFEQSPLLPSPKKSALKNPLAKKSMRKTESIKFDLSNLENKSQDSDVMAVAESPQDTLSLRYSTSSALSPSPRRSIHSRSSRMLEQSLGTPVLLSPSSKSATLTPESPRRSTSLRGSVILQRALNKSAESVSRSSREASASSAFRTRTLSPREPQNDLESYSIVDLVSIDSNESGPSTSVYNSAGSSSSAAFGTPRDSTGRKTRSTIDATLLGSSTPYVKDTRSSTPRSRSSPNVSTRTSNDSTRLTTDLTSRSTRASKNTSNSTSRLSSNSSRLSSNSSRLSSKSSRSINKSSASTRKTKSLSTPENATIPISVNSTRISRASRSRSRINDSDLLLIEPEDADDSPRSSKRASKGSKRSSSAPQRGSKSSVSTPVGTPAQENGISTPENNQSPEEASTPVLSIQSLLDSSHNSIRSQTKKRGRPSLKRKTIGVITQPKARVSTKSKSMNFSVRRSRLRVSNDSFENMNVSEQNSENVTPKSAVKLVHEAVKNKHSTAKKTQSKRSMIDDLNDSDIVKQLFNSPVKRKLSQSMTEFSRKHLFDGDDVVQARRPTRNTVALTGRTPDNSLLDNSEAFTPEQFVSPISTPSHSPNLTGIKRLFVKKTPENDLRNVRGVKGLLRTPRARRSIRNDLTDVVGVKAVFAKSPRNRLSDVRVKEVFASSPKNDLRRVSGVKSLFQSERERKSPRNSLGDVRGVKRMFNRKSVVNDLRNVSGVKKALQRNSPNNDLRDVRGVKRLFRQDKARNDLSDMSGVEELFNESNTSHRDTDSLFDQLIGKPTIKAVYSKTFTSKKAQKKTSPKSKSLVSLNIITDNPEEWLEQKLQEIRSKRLHKEAQSKSKSANKSKLNVGRALMKLATDTVEGSSPLRTTRVRHSTVTRTSFIEVPKRQKSASELYSAHMLPIKKRSLVDASLERVKKDKVVNLPIKKRVVVHSTPMKGRQVNMTMNASELGRVSPIVAEKTRDLEHDLASSTINKEAVESRPKGRRGTTAQSATSPKVKKPTPKKTRGKSKVPTPVKTKPATPAKDKTPAKTNKPSPAKKPATPIKDKTPAKTNKQSPAKKPATPIKDKTPAKTNKQSPAKKPATPIKDKTPAKTKTPSPAKKPASPAAKVASPKKTRSRRTAASPKAEANTKKRGATLVVAKKSPVMSPKASRARKVTESAPSPKASPKASRKRKEIESAPVPEASPKASRARKVPESVPTSKASPKASRKRKEPEPVPTSKASPKGSRKRKELESAPAPKASPKASRKRKEPESLPTPKASPKRTRAARNNDNVVEKPKTPKNTRAKVLKTTVVVSKPSPQLKPRATRGRPQQSTSQLQKETPKQKAKSKKESPKKSPVKQISAKNTSVENEPKTRRRKNTTTNNESKQNDVEKPEPKPKRGRNANVEEPVTRNTRKTDKQEVPAEEPKKPRGKKIVPQESTQSEPTTRSRRGNKPNTTAPEINTRKRKSTASDDRPAKVSKNMEVETKGRSKKIESPKSATANVPKKAGRESKGNKKQGASAAPKKTTRTNKTDVSVEVTKQPAQRATRGKKSAVVDSVPETGKRKRKTAVEATPVEDKKTRSTRSRAEPAAAASKTTGRARRR